MEGHDFPHAHHAASPNHLPNTTQLLLVESGFGRYTTDHMQPRVLANKLCVVLKWWECAPHSQPRGASRRQGKAGITANRCGLPSNPTQPYIQPQPKHSNSVSVCCRCNLDLIKPAVDWRKAGVKVNTMGAAVAKA
jgi:hypothetical protein